MWSETQIYTHKNKSIRNGISESEIATKACSKFQGHEPGLMLSSFISSLKCNYYIVFNGNRASVWKDEKVLWMDCGYTAIRM